MSVRLALLPLILTAACAAAPPEKPVPRVRASLDDGQVIVGELATRRIRLKTGMGLLDIAAEDAGELGLVEGKNVDQSGNMIRLWLRNGSELVGEWQNPDAAIALAIGGQVVSLKAPIKKLKRLQFSGEPVWPTGAVFRIKTRHGDDFFVDVTKTRLSFRNEMGAFSPFLSEIRHLEALDAARESWRLFLMNGTVFKTKFDKEELSLQLTMGPKDVRLPLSDITLMERQVLRRVLLDQSVETPQQGGFNPNIIGIGRQLNGSGTRLGPNNPATGNPTFGYNSMGGRLEAVAFPEDRPESERGFYDKSAQSSAKSAARPLWTPPER